VQQPLLRQALRVYVTVVEREGKLGGVVALPCRLARTTRECDSGRLRAARPVNWLRKPGSDCHYIGRMI
jgi:hypothetical protein